MFSEGKHSERRDNCVLLLTHKHSVSQRLCQRGGSLFVYCLYTEKRKTASIMQNLDSGSPQSPINLKAKGTKASLFDKQDMV